MKLILRIGLVSLYLALGLLALSFFWKVHPENTTAQAEQPALGPGWKMVPLEPTDAMLDAGRAAGAGPGWLQAYEAMIKAAPKQ